MLLLASAPFVMPAAGHSEIHDQTNRWEHSIEMFEASDRIHGPTVNAVLFTGASNIRLWKNIGQAFPHHKILNRGFGGAEMSDLAEFAGRIVIPCKPKIVIIYAGDNDLADRKTPEKILSDFNIFAREVHATLPCTLIGCIAVKPSPSRARLVPMVCKTDALLQACCRTSTNTIYIDDLTPMLNAKGEPRPELFGKDGLHLNDRGRKVWASLITPILDRYDPPASNLSL